MKKILALILIALFIPMSPANADTPNPVVFLKPLELQTIIAPIPDNGFSSYTFSVLASNIYNNVNVTYFQLLDCNNVGQDTKRIWWNSFYPSTGDVDARGKTITVTDLTFSGVAWSRTGVGVCTGNWKMKVTVSMINKSLNQDIVTITEIPTVYPIKIVEPATTPWIQSHIEEINKIAEGWRKATEALEANQKAEASALILKQQAEKLKRDLVNGTACKKLGSTKLAGGQKFICKKIGTKLVWR
jgi:hypothetical protein